MVFRFQPLQLPGVILVKPQIHGDARGFFQETYRRSLFREGGIREEFVQDNHARSREGVLRGLHFQRPPRVQGKLVRVVRGRVFDVAVDLRVGSPAFGRWVGVELGEEGSMLYLPPGMAHGYCVLTPVADLVYKVTAEFAPELEGGIRWDDPQVGITWPLAEPALSERDRALPALAELSSPFTFTPEDEA